MSSKLRAGLQTLFTGGKMGKTGIVNTVLPKATLGLSELLSRQGGTNPLSMNMMLSDVGHQTQGLQQQLQSTLNQQGINANSGLGMALNATIGQGGAQRRQGVIANESQMAEQRYRQDLAQALGLLGPSMGFQNQIAQQEFMQQQLDNQRQGAMIGGLGALGGGIMGGPLGAQLGQMLANKASGGGNQSQAQFWMGGNQGPV